MKKVLVLFAALGFVACGASLSQAEVLTNGNLDLTYAQVIVDNPDPMDDFFLPKPLGWVNEGFRTIAGPYEDEMSSEPWAGPAPTPVTTDGLANPPHPEGCGGPDCAVFFKPFSGNATDGAATGHLYQDNPATPGVRYVLTGWAGAEANALMTGAEIALEFLDAGNSVIPASGQIVDLLPTLYVDNGEAFDYKKYTAAAVAPANAASVRARASFIGGLGNPAGGGQAFVVDDFSLLAVPEPATFALVGLAVAGLIGIRRRS